MSSNPKSTDDIDLPVEGAEAIAEVLNLFDKEGQLDTRRAYYILENGYCDASKPGRIWTSTRRRLLNPAFQSPDKPKKSREAEAAARDAGSAVG
jgi:hypothetical protein